MKWFRLRLDKFSYSDNRKKGVKSFIVSSATILIAILVALFICMGIYKDGGLFGDIFYQIFTAPFHKSNVSTLFVNFSIFAVAACAFIFAFKCGLFNIGISGQMLFGAMIAIIIGQYMGNVPNGIGQIIMILIGMIAAGMIAGIIAILKSFFNVNEVVSSIMLNWIVYFVGTYIVKCACKADQSGSYTQQLSNNVLLSCNGSGAIPLTIIAIILIIFCFVIFKYTVFGKKITNLGMSLDGSRYAGYSVKINQITTMVISGLIAGVLGIMVYCGRSLGTVPIDISAKAIPNEGFNGISVGLIAMNNPIGIIPVSFLFGMIETAKASIAQNCGVDSNITDLMFGIVVYAAAAVSLLYYLQPWKWYMKWHYKKHHTISYDEHEFNVENQINLYLDAVYLINKKYKDSIFKNLIIKMYKNKFFNKFISKKFYTSVVKNKKTYHANELLKKLKINSKDVNNRNIHKKLLNKIYVHYEKNRLSKGEE